MFWGLANCPPETVERVLGNYNKIMEDRKNVELGLLSFFPSPFVLLEYDREKKGMIQ